MAHAPDSVERFRREGEALRMLNHPNIVKMLATLEEDGQHYLVMEYVGGGSLADLLKRQSQLPIEQVISIGLELSDALSRAHHLEIVHRDIKPGNILLAEDGTPRLTDFGLAHLGSYPALTTAGQLLGTFQYLSPEACANQPLDVVTRTDYRGRVWGGNQRLTVPEALKVCTLHGAYASKEEGHKGSIAAGKLADFVILARDPHAEGPGKIKDIPVLRTVLGGRTTHQA